MEINLEINFGWYHWMLVFSFAVYGILRSLPVTDSAAMVGRVAGSIIGAFFWVGLGVLVWQKATG